MKTSEEEISQLSNIVGHKNQVHFYVLTALWKMKSKTYSLKITFRNIKYLEKLNEGAHNPYIKHYKTLLREIKD